MRLLQDNIAKMDVNAGSVKTEQKPDFHAVIKESLDKIKTSNETIQNQVNEGENMENMMKELTEMMSSGDFEDVFGV
jgi:Pex19 protein family